MARSDSSKRSVHVIPKSGQWAVRREGAERATSVHSTKEKAVAAGRLTAKESATELVVHNKSGLISSRDTYANDPNPLRNKKK